MSKIRLLIFPVIALKKVSGWAMTDSNRRHPRCKRGGGDLELLQDKGLTTKGSAACTSEGENDNAAPSKAASLATSQADANQGLEWLYSFAGGLLTTCGLTHVGGPEEDEFGRRGLHGRISNLPATVESIVQPDLAAGKLEMSITAVVTINR